MGEGVYLNIGLTAVVAALLAIDIVYRVRLKKKVLEQGIASADAANGKNKPGFMDFFRDYGDKLSWTRLALTALLVFAVIVVIIGLVVPDIWDKAKDTFVAVLDWCKWLFGISKTPEAVNQMSQLIKPAETPAAPPSAGGPPA